MFNIIIYIIYSTTHNNFLKIMNLSTLKIIIFIILMIKTTGIINIAKIYIILLRLLLNKYYYPPLFI